MEIEKTKINNKKTVLILGGLGFIGNNLIEEFLESEKYHIIVFEAKNNHFLESTKQGVKVYYGDFNNTNDLERIFMNNNIDIIIHLISTTIPSNSNENIIYDINTNLINTIKLLDLMKKYNVKKIIYPSSGGTVYGLLEKNGNKSFTEKYPTNPICSHGIIKLSIEKYFYLYKYLYGIDYLILRISNPYGEFHTSDKQGLINVALKRIISKKSVIVWGNGEITRDYIYIKDVVKIIRQLVEKSIFNQVINIGSGVGYSINQVLTIIKDIVGDFQIEKKEGRNFDVPYVVLNIEKLKLIINPHITELQDGIKKTYEWLKSK